MLEVIHKTKRMQIQSEIFNDPKLAEHTISNFLDRKREDSNIKPFPNKEE